MFDPEYAPVIAKLRSLAPSPSESAVPLPVHLNEESYTMNKNLGILAVLVFTASYCLTAKAASPKTAGGPERPNIVFFFADDLGYADLACYGHPYAKTPALDRLASEGARFMQHYVTGVTCNPSRTGLMTGLFPARFPRCAADFGFGALAMREGKWKLHLGSRRRRETELYDLSVDEAESQNVAKEHPEVAARMTAKLKAWVAELPEHYEKKGGRRK
jgi:arylsulfatase A-like enzyme